MDGELNILYQDEWLIAIDKPAGYLVHPSDHPQASDLVAMKILRDQIGQAVNPIHRIDRPTTGVLLFGLTKEITKKLVQAHSTFNKTYLAVSRGLLHSQSWECHEPIQKKDNAPFREAHTSFKVLKSITHPDLKNIPNQGDCGQLHLIEATPHTGRFHQIRRHLHHAGLPIIGDYRYAGMEISEIIDSTLSLDTRMLLQAHSLEFTHPALEKKISITTPMDAYFKKLGLTPF